MIDQNVLRKMTEKIESTKSDDSSHSYPININTLGCSGAILFYNHVHTIGNAKKEVSGC